MQHRIVHDCLAVDDDIFAVDDDIVWETVTRELQLLLAQFRPLLDQTSGTDEG